MCRLLDVNPSGYYAWVARPPSAQALRQLEIQRLVAVQHQQSHQVYGYRKIHQQLLRQGFQVSRETVRRAMAAQSLSSRAQTKRRTRSCLTDSNHQHPIAANLLNRDFHADRPNQKWVTDITQLPMKNGKNLYLATVLDLFSRMIVGWAVGLTMEVGLVIKAFESAVATRLRKGEGDGLIHHSDRGSQYASWEYRNLLTLTGVTMSMSRKGNCWDNAAQESFFGHFKTEWIKHCQIIDLEHGSILIHEYIATFYNRERLHQSLGYKTPAQVEEEYNQQASQRVSG